MNINSKKTISKNFFDFISRFFISAIFIAAIPKKLSNFGLTTDFIASKGIPEVLAQILLIAAIICLILGSGFLIFSKDKNLGAIFLLVFLIPTTIIFHLSPFQERAFLINISLIGSLLLTILRK